MKIKLYIILFAIIVFLAGSSRIQASNGLKLRFYKKTCPQAEQIVQDIVWKKTASKPELAAQLIRMHFHDCFVRGCDASILLDSTSNSSSEKLARPNQTVRGFEDIDEVKAALEKACPGIVSCADVIALAARDAVSYQFKKALWEVKTGRRDGLVSLQAEANSNIPSPFSNFSTLVGKFANKSLDVKDLVVLSGAHTIGIAHCNAFSRRLYNFTGKNDLDSSLDRTYAAFLKTKCRSLSDNTTTVPMDPGSITKFDTNYFYNLKLNKGLFQSDAALLTNERSSKLVDKLLNSENFLNEFSNSVKAMGEIEVKTGVNGQIRKNCRVVN